MGPGLRIPVTDVQIHRVATFFTHTQRSDTAIFKETKFTLDKISLPEFSIPGYGERMRFAHTGLGRGMAVWCKSSVAVALPNILLEQRLMICLD